MPCWPGCRCPERPTCELAGSAPPTGAPVMSRSPTHLPHADQPRYCRQASSAGRATSASLDELESVAPEPIVSVSLRAWPVDFPDDIAVQRRTPYEARADAIMYRQELSELAHARDWEVHLYDAKAVMGQAVGMLAERADAVLQGPRARMGPPWTKDHRIALA